MKVKGGAKVQENDKQLKDLLCNHGLGPGDVVLAEARVIEGRLLQATCVYVAMTLGAHPDIASNCSDGAKQRGLLKTVVEELEGLPANVKEELEALFPDRWAELRQLSGMPPGMPTASGPGGVSLQQEQQLQHQQQPPQKKRRIPDKQQSPQVIE